MPRGGKRGGARATPRNVPRLRSSGGLDRLAPNPLPGTSPAGFTLQDEARSTAHRSSPWSSDSRLRHRPVTFVNTGTSEPLKQLEAILQPEESADKPEETSDAVSTPPKNQPDDTLLDKPAPTSDEAHVPHETPADIAGNFAGFILDDDESMDATITIREKEDNTTNVETRSVAEAPTSLPFFLDVTGDKQLHDSIPIRLSDRSPSPIPSDSSEEVILFRGRNKAPRNKRKQRAKPKPSNLDGVQTELKVVEKKVKSKGSVGVSVKGGLDSTQQSCEDFKTQKHREEADLVADYIANMRDYGDEGSIPVQAYARRDIGGSLSESESVEPSQTINALGKAKAFSSDDDSELDDMSVEWDITSQVSHVKLPRGARKPPGRGEVTCVDNGTFALLESDVSCLGLFEPSQAEDASPQSETSNQDDIEDGVFASAADRFANEVDDFDFMDWSRPALKRKKGKGAKGKVPVFDISDSELEGKMQAAWKNDRFKKAERKRERQALRTQGLLGKHANPEDLRVKYPHGMGLGQIADELRMFLLSTQPSLTLPPMDNHARKVIHELASKFNIKSKSTGSGDQRRPMLHRTFKTAKFSDEIFDTAIARVGRKYFPRNDTAVRAAVQRHSARRGGGGGGAHAGVLYRDGEVVGGSAPELGQENKGRAMLEKMGWSSGTALGALNNKGILQPVAHIVKRSKAGLG